MNKLLFVLFLIMTLTGIISAQKPSEDTFRIYDGEGNPADLGRIIEAAGKNDVIFLGENHDDSVAHALQFEIFKSVLDRYGEQREAALSLEMFERDVQIVLNEYLEDLITEKKFLEDSRPWGNYQTDYRPLVELARERKLPVIAANAPRRYVNMVSRLGRDSLEKLSPGSRKWLAPLPFGQSSKAYSDKFNALMQGHGSSNILDSQTLWDATMAFSVSEFLRKNKRPLVVHLNGSFHTESRLGTVEQLQKFNPEARILVVTLKYVDDFKSFDQKYAGLGDFIILTDDKQPRSKR
ncbi:MAG: ChaN family lipoprotein [Pyrinomonadaceae bacterium]